MKRTIFTILALAAMCAAQADSPHARELPFSLGGNFGPDFQHQAGIADNQMKAMSTVAEVNRTKLVELRDEVGKKEAELQEILNAGTVDLAAAEKAVDAVMEARNRLAKMQTMMVINMRLILTSDQWRKMQELQARYTPAQAAGSTSGAVGMSREEANEASASATVRTLNTAEFTFLSSYKKGFTDGLNRLGSPANGIPYDENHADMVDQVLSGFAPNGSNLSFQKNGYKFTYTPGPGGYGNIQSYTITAQPLEYGASGTKSFYTDEKAVVHVTSDNRVAGPNDPGLNSAPPARPAQVRKPDQDDKQ